MTTLSGFSTTIQPMDTMHMKLSHSMSFQSGNNNPAGGLTRRQKFKLEPIKILEPSNKKLTLPESQRIMFILEELARKIEMVDYIDTIVQNLEKVKHIIKENVNDEEKRKSLDEIIISMLQHHKSLIDAYNKGQFKTEFKTGFDTGDRSSPGLQTKETLESLIKNSCKDILRVFNSKPILYESIRSELAKNKSKNHLINELSSLFKEAKEILLEKLLTTPNEQNEKIEYLRELLIREKSNNELVKKLKDEQSIALADKEKEVQIRNDQIRKLDNDLKNVERFNTETVKRTKVDAEQQESSEIKASEGRKAKLQAELNQLRQLFTTLVAEHKDQEQQLRKDKLKHETNVEGLLSRYDDEMTKKQAEFDEVEGLHEEEKKLLDELEEKFKPLEEEYLKITEERKMLEAIRRMEEESLNKKIKAAVVIQSYWRGFKLRKGLFKKGKGKKGKKGKK